MSCPEIARLVLTAPPQEPLFVPTPAPAQDPGIDRSVLPMEMLTLSAFVDTVISAERYGLGAKLYVIGNALVRLGRLSEAGRLSERDFTQMERGAGQALFDAQATLKAQHLRPPTQVAGAFWAGIFQLARSTGVLEDLPAISDIPVPDGATPDEARHAAIYAEVCGWREHGQAVLRERYDKALARYTATSFRNKRFPLDPMAQNFVATFLYCVLPLVVIVLRLWHIAAQGRPVDDAEVVRAVYRAERGLAHNRRLYQIMNRNPDLLRLNAYLTCIAQLP